MGTGFGPVGSDAEVTFTASTGAFCGHGTSVSVTGQITSTTTIEGLTPGMGVGAGLDAVVSVVLPGGVIPQGSAVAQFQPPPGTGAFVDALAGLTGRNVTTVSLGDVNGDGHLDLVAANGGSLTADVAVFVNDGSGGLVPAGTFAAVAAPLRATLGDLDGDGDLDAVVAPYQSTLANVWKNDGTGVFTAFGTSLGSFAPWTVQLADLDGDHDLDILMGMDTGGGNRTFVNDGNGTFAPGATFTTAGRTMAIATADVDGDQDLDVFAGNSGTLMLFLNNGAGALSPSPHIFTNSMDNVQVILPGDVDGDGDEDVLVAYEAKGAHVYLNDGAGVFTNTGQTLGDATGDFTRVFGGALGDIDGDCDLDVVFGNATGFNDLFGDPVDGRTTVWTNSGNGTFSDSGQRLGAINSFTLSVALGDLDRDGDLDLFFADGAGINIEVYTNP
jgi:hypothetical protein